MNSTSRGPIWFGIALVIVVIAIGAWIYFLPNGGTLNVGVTLATSPATILVGQPFTLSVMLANDSGSALSNASVSLVLPAGIVSVDNPGERVVSQSIGNVGDGGVSHESFTLIATGGANTVEDFSANVTYSAAGSSAQFESAGMLDVALGQSVVGVSISAPPNIFSGQDFPITVTYHNNSTSTIEGMSIAMQYPPAFTFIKASSSLETNGNSSWSLGNIPANGNGTITIAGSLVGPNNASYPISAQLSENIASSSYPLASPAASIVLSQSPLSFSISANNSQNYIAAPGDTINYVLNFTNNSTVTFQNITINAHLVGGMFDFSSLDSDGSFNSVANTLTWNSASSPQLLSLAPGQTGSVGFRINTQDAFPIRLLSDKNYSLAVSAELVSPTVPPGTAASATISVANITTPLGGKIVLSSEAYHEDPQSVGFSNLGPYPPRENQATEYTIHWLLTNYATDADNVNISAYLQSGTSCTNNMKVPASSTFTCDPSSGQVTWTIPVVPATTGIADAPLQAVFQVTNTPGVNEVGQNITLIGPATLTATDGFTNQPMNASVPAMTTALPDDTSVATQERQVQQ